MIIGICGKSGSGKTAICDELKNLGAYVIDADVIAREIMNEDVLTKVKQAFPDCFEDNCLNRKKLGSRVFNSCEELKTLNSITHPLIKSEILIRIHLNKNLYRYIVVDAAVLLEAGMKDIFDCIVAVTASDSVRLERIMIRDCLTYSGALDRISAQKPDEYYMDNTDFYIMNNGDKPLCELAEEILKRSSEFVESQHDS